MIRTFKEPQRVRQQVRKWHQHGLSVGLVPTMGALHEGHLSLVRKAVQECDRTVVSIFVNPTQFGPDEDFDEYPRTLQKDIDLLEMEGADVVFAPTERQMYFPDSCTFVDQEVLTDKLCGAHRPGHFRGVLTIVAKLFNVTEPDKAYFGRKDFQQSVVLRRMSRDLNFHVEIRVGPTVRESDGLAASSRNDYLNEEQRQQATCLYKALQKAREMFSAGARSPKKLIDEMRRIIEERPAAELQYCEIVSSDDLKRVEKAADDSIAALAVFLGETRLIDNMPLGECDDIFLNPDQ
ncbi:MAG: pantoate--beta-alanine ligase [Candidatus Brocadiia bacterium]